jgi:exonuclease SbcC
MKPITLVLENIGPFVGKHSIDFTALEEFFLISGKTGSGKTTILDSITYALYGKLAGARSNMENTNLRSHFASSEDESSITLTFSILSVVYKIIRILPYWHTTKTGKTTKTGDSSSLFQIEDQEKLISNQKTEVDNYLQSLIGLSVDEFTKIVLLPQGEFARFLQQSSTEKKPTLQKLFPIDDYTKIAEEIKDKKNSLSITFQGFCNQQKELETRFSPDTYTDQVTILTEKQDRLKKEKTTNQKNLDKAKFEEEKLKNQIQLCTEYLSIKEKLVEHKKQENTIFIEKEKLQRGKVASQIIPLISDLKRIEKEFTELQLTNEKETAELAEANNTNIKLRDLASTYEEKNRTKEQLEKQCENLEKAVEAKQKYTEEGDKTQKLIEVKNNIEKNLQEIKGQLEPLLSFVEENQDIHKKLLEAEERLRDLQKNLEETKLYRQRETAKSHYNQLLTEENEKIQIDTAASLLLEEYRATLEAERKENLAFQLAENLVEEQACPVCGSLHHPHLAQKPSTTLDTQSKIHTQESLIQTNKKELSSITAEKNKIMGIVQQLEAQLPKEKPANTELEIEDKLEKQKSAIDCLKELNEKKESYEKQIQSLTQEKEPLEKQLQEYKMSISLAENTVTHRKEILDNLLANSGITEKENDIELSYQEKIKTIQTLESQINNYNNEKEENQTHITILKERLENGKHLRENKEKELEKGTLKLEQTLKTSIFDTKEEVEKDFLTLELIEEKEKQIQNWENIKTQLESKLEQMQTQYQGDLSQLQNQQIQAKNQIEEYTILLDNVEKEIETLQVEIHRIQEYKTQYDIILEKKEKINTDLITYSNLHEALSGGNPKKIPLDSWILSSYLEEITTFASRRLERISEQRYTLGLKEDTSLGRGNKGLDLEIYDSYTGKTRPCNTLSGGETFMASISLALAISDVVQSRNGGIQLDSLFIDEGFGSLDGETLEQALSILDEVRGSRCVGIISHVGNLQTRISSQIIVEKGSTGSKIVMD